MFNKLTRYLWIALAARKRSKDRQDLLARATDAVVEGTDPRIRAVGGYRKKLLPAIKTSIIYVQDIVDQVPGPIVLTPSRYGKDPTVHALFAGVDDLRSLLANSKEVHQLFDPGDNGQPPRRVHAFLAMERLEKKVFAPAMVNRILRRDIAQVMVSFTRLQLVAVADRGYRARRLLMRRAFYDLIASAMEHLAELQGQRDHDSRQVQMRRVRLQALHQKRHGLEDMIAGSAAHDREIAELEQQLSPEERMGRDQPKQALNTLEDYLDQIVEVFANPQQYLRTEQTSVHLTRMNRKLSPGGPEKVNEIRMTDALNSRGERVSVIAVCIPRAGMPEPAAPSQWQS
jgi:hypothetical protein